MKAHNNIDGYVNYMVREGDLPEVIMNDDDMPDLVTVGSINTGADIEEGVSSVDLMHPHHVY